MLGPPCPKDSHGRTMVDWPQCTPPLGFAGTITFGGEPKASWDVDVTPIDAYCKAVPGLAAAQVEPPPAGATDPEFGSGVREKECEAGVALCAAQWQLIQNCRVARKKS